MKYQMVCPECKHEFTYDNGYYDENLARLRVEINEIILQISEHKKMPYTQQRQRTDWWLRAKASLAQKQKEYSELKALRKLNDQQLKAMEYQTFKNIVKQEMGEETYLKWINKMQEELEAYKLSGIMRHEYTKSNSKTNAISINKL